MNTSAQQQTLSRLCDSIRTSRDDPNADPGAVQVVERIASHLSSGPSTATPTNSKEVDPVLAQVAAQRLALIRLSRSMPIPPSVLQEATGTMGSEALLQSDKQDSLLNGLMDPPRPHGGLPEVRKNIKEVLDLKLAARRQELRVMPDGVPNEVRMAALVDKKKVHLAALQRKLRRSVRAEQWLQDNVKLEGLMEWNHLRRPMPDNGHETIPLYRHCPAQPLVQQPMVKEDEKEVERYQQHDDNLRRQSVYDHVNELRLSAARKVVEEEKRRKEEDDRITKLEQETKMRAIQQRRAFLQDVLGAGREMRSSVANASRRKAQRNTGIRSWHNRELKNMSRQAAARVRALKEHDYEKYLELARNAKDDRLKELMKKTDDIIIELGLKVQDQRKEAKGGDDADPIDEEMNSSDFASVLRGSSDNSDRFLQGHLNYYNMVHHTKEKISVQPKMMVGGKIRAYQLDGLRFLISLHNNRLNGILADEMGLGKTIQTIALLAYLMEFKGNNGPHVVIAPKAVIHNWVREFEKWAPAMKVIMYDGTAEERKLYRQEVLECTSFNVVVTHYDLIIRDKGLFKKIQWEHLIVDEGHRLKNAESKLFEILRDQRCRCRLLLTGTPIQNSLKELWALLNFLLPKVFHSAESFDEWFASPFKGAREDVASQLMDEEQLLVINRLHQVIRPFMLRRTKKEVEKELPSKIERSIKCDLSAWQRIYYSQISEKAQVRRDGKVRHLNNISMHMRKACNHPYLFLDRSQHNPSDPEEIVRASGKLELLDRILPKLKKAGHRVLLFSQMTSALNVIEEFLEMRGMNYLRLDGTTKTDDRRTMLDDFNDENSPYFIFMLSTRAGGLGLNLQTADTVIMFDSDWNPAMDLQAEDRAHRIGQKRDVLVIVLVCAGTIEEVIQERAFQKRELDAKVIQAGMFNDKSTHSERQQALKMILSRGEDFVGGDVPTEIEVNELIARNRDEFMLFEEMDEERRNLEGGKSRLMTMEEVPSWVLEDNESDAKDKSEASEDEENGVRKRRRRKITRISYAQSSHSLTSSQESSDEEMEESIPVKQVTKRPIQDGDESCDDDNESPPSKIRRISETARMGMKAKRGRGRGRGQGRGRGRGRGIKTTENGDAEKSVGKKSLKGNRRGRGGKRPSE